MGSGRKGLHMLQLKHIKKEYKTPSGVYILCGEEDYLKRFYAAGMREATRPMRSSTM